MSTQQVDEPTAQETASNTQTKTLEDKYLPYLASNIQFARYTSELPLLDINNKRNTIHKKYILVHDTLFYEYYFDNNKVKYNTTNNIYKNEYGDLKYIGLKDGKYLHSYIINIGRYGWGNQTRT